MPELSLKQQLELITAKKDDLIQLKEERQFCIKRDLHFIRDSWIEMGKTLPEVGWIFELMSKVLDDDEDIPDLGTELMTEISTSVESTKQEIVEKRQELGECMHSTKKLIKELRLEEEDIELTEMDQFVLDNVEMVAELPTKVDMINKLKKRRSKLKRIKTERVQSLTYLGKELISLWKNLDVPSDETKSFFNDNSGIGEKTIKACQLEVAKLRKQQQNKWKREYHTLVENIEIRCGELFRSTKELDQFLSHHFPESENSANNISAEKMVSTQKLFEQMDQMVKQKDNIMNIITKHKSLKEEVAEYELAEQDPQRFKQAKKMLEMEKIRNKIKHEYPKLKTRLQTALAKYESEFGQFPWERSNGLSYLEQLEAEEKLKQSIKEEEATKRKKRKAKEIEEYAHTLDQADDFGQVLSINEFENSLDFMASHEAIVPRRATTAAQARPHTSQGLKGNRRLTNAPSCVKIQEEKEKKVARRETLSARKDRTTLFNERPPFVVASPNTRRASTVAWGDDRPPFVVMHTNSRRLTVQPESAKKKKEVRSRANSASKGSSNPTDKDKPSPPKKPRIENTEVMIPSKENITPPSNNNTRSKSKSLRRKRVSFAGGDDNDLPKSDDTNSPKPESIPEAKPSLKAVLMKKRSASIKGKPSSSSRVTRTSEKNKAARKPRSKTEKRSKKIAPKISTRLRRKNSENSDPVEKEKTTKIGRGSDRKRKSVSSDENVKKTSAKKDIALKKKSKKKTLKRAVLKAVNKAWV